jgi:hypothetical protein
MFKGTHWEEKVKKGIPIPCGCSNNSFVPYRYIKKGIHQCKKCLGNKKEKCTSCDRLTAKRLLSKKTMRCQECIKLENKKYHDWDQICYKCEEGILYGCGCYYREQF